MKEKGLNIRASVAAIIPNYNYADFLIERIDSVLNQTYPISELIILDDASTDNSISVIKEKLSEIKHEHPGFRVKLIINKENSGGCVFAQWKRGINEAKSDYFWIAEADDVADERFLEVAMEKFREHPSAVLFYSDSRRINQNGDIISETCSDWADMWGKGRWNEDFFNNGKDEIINYLSGTNPILNVSSVVWKKQEELFKIFDEAKNFKVAGDWYIYTRVLENGDIVYSSETLNNYRKHDKGSASTVVKLSKEYGEVVRVQERVAQEYQLNNEQLEWQKVRRRGMGMVENEKNKNKKGRVAWFIPDFVEGSGGHRTIFQNINKLVDEGYACDMYVKLIYGQRTPRVIYDEIIRDYGDFKGDVYTGLELVDVKKYDAIVATSWETAEPVRQTNIGKKMYFIQDYEPWFFPMSEEFLLAKKSYGYGFIGFSIGRWLTNKITDEYGAKVTNFDFCADLDVYKRDKKTKKENAICFIYQPLKPRRCADMGLKALQIVQSLRPDVKVYLYGSQKVEVSGLRAEHLGVIPTDQCNKLYNKCKVGLCISTTNPSRIPFEMMAAGLPVVDLFGENTVYDLPEDGCLLAEPSPEAIATAILNILNNDKLRSGMSKGGADYMKQFPLKKGFDQFADSFDKCFNNKKVNFGKPKKLYRRKGIPALVESSDKLPEITIKTFEEIEFEKKEKIEKEKRLAEEEWRRNLTIPQRIYLKIRYILLKR